MKEAILAACCTCFSMSLSLEEKVFIKVLFFIITVFGFTSSFPFVPRLRTTNKYYNYNFFNNDFSVAFTMNTSGCSIPGMMVHNYSRKKFGHYRNSYNNSCPNSNHPLLQSNLTHIWVVSENFQRYHVYNSSLFKCCYQSFHQSSVLTFTNTSIDRVAYLDCIMFKKSIEAENEFVNVKCYYNNNVIYKQFFIFVPKKYFTVSHEHLQIDEVFPTYNVIIMGLRSMSRLNMHRAMPNTYKVLMELGAVVLFGYHAISTNTLKNIVPIVTGMTAYELNVTCMPRSQPVLDSCSFIWERFKDVGYHTALIEDRARSGIFNSKTFGFSDSPTDYYVHPFIQETENIKTKIKIRYVRKRIGIFKIPIKIKTKKLRKKESICMGNQYYFQFILDYVERLTAILRTSKLFGVFWESLLGKDLNASKLIDHKYETLIRKLKDNGYLDQTILILLSDHGLSHGNIVASKQGRLEQRLPLAAIVTPPAFRQQYSIAYQSLKINSNRLTTPFDIYETLSDLTDMKSLKNINLINRSKSNLVYERGRSLFLPIPSNRTCESAGIGKHWCTCHEKEKMNLMSDLVNNAVEYLVMHLNWLLKLYPQCARLAVDKVLSFEELYPTYAKEMEWREFKGVVRVKPGAGEYEALLRYDNDVMWSLMTQLRRLDVGTENSNCVQDKQIKLYCQCSA